MIALNKLSSAVSARSILLFGIFSSLIALLVVQQYLSAPFAVQAGYTTIGLIAALIIVEASRTEIKYTLPIEGRHHQYQKAVLLLLFMSVILLVSFELMFPVLLVLLPLGYLLTFVQYLELKRVTPPLLAQLLGLFFVASYSKLATTFFYIGEMDLIKHTRFINELWAAGTPSAITSNYSGFFALHVASGTISEVTTISPHDSMVALGIFSFTFLLLALYLLLSEYTDSKNIAYLSVLLLSASSTYLFFSNYFFPQSFALTLFFFLLSAIVLSQSHRSRRLTLITLPISLALVISHHFTLILILPVLFVLFSGDVLSSYFGRRSGDMVHYGRVNWIIMALPFVGALYYWGDTAAVFFGALWEISSNIIETFTTRGVSDGGADANILFLGTEPIERTTSTAIAWLYSINGIYQILLVALLALGALAIWLDSDYRQNSLSVITLGLLGSILLLDTPLTVKSLTRLAFPLSIFVFVIAGYGIHWLTINTNVKGALPSLVLVFLFATAGPLMAADDVRNYQGDVDPRQGSVSEQEYIQLESASAHINEHEIDQVSTLLVTRQMLTLFGATPSSEITVSNSTIESPNSVVYSEQWTENRPRVRNENSTYLNYTRISPEWLENHLSNSNKTYDAGTISIGHQP